MEVRETATKLHGAGPGEPCPPLPPVFVRVLGMRSYFVDFHRQCKQRTISQTTYSNFDEFGRNLVQMSFSQRKLQIKNWKKESETPWS